MAERFVVVVSRRVVNVAHLPRMDIIKTAYGPFFDFDCALSFREANAHLADTLIIHPLRSPDARLPAPDRSLRSAAMD